MSRRRRANNIPDAPITRGIVVRPRLRTAMRLIEDARVWSPEGQFAAPRSFPNTRKSRLVVRNANFSNNRFRKAKTLPSQLGFSFPKHVIRCVRRKVRKEVLIAKKRSGRGTRKRFNFWSSISC